MSRDGALDLRAAASAPLAQRLSPRYLEEHGLLPLGVDSDGRVAVAAGAPLEDTVRDELVRLFGRPLRVVDAPEGEIRAAILAAGREAPHVTNGAADVAVVNDNDAESSDDLRALASQGPVITLVNVLLIDALRASASDVHIESTIDGLRVRYRLDGVLRDVSQLARQYQSAVISRVKIMAGIDIAERRLPQDGRARVRVGDREVDLRVSTLPSLHGESVVVRILDHGARARDLFEIGMSAALRDQFERLVQRTSGIVLVTGPTGSGKTTTLYGALSRINAPGVKVLTVEDPVEYQIGGVVQIPINRKAGVTFASALRSMLRHDPDVIMIGEMRDRETAEIAIQAALTGHLVFSTLHTNDAVSGVTRLVDMGIEPYLVAATVQGILAQRLVRVLCPACAAPADAPPGEHAGRWRRPVGCDQCANAGYRGRSGLFELYTLGETDRSAIVARAPLADLRAAARVAGMVPLREAGLRAAREGVTSIEEVLRVTSGSDGD